MKVVWSHMCTNHEFIDMEEVFKFRTDFSSRHTYLQSNILPAIDVYNMYIYILFFYPFKKKCLETNPYIYGYSIISGAISATCPLTPNPRYRGPRLSQLAAPKIRNCTSQALKRQSMEAPIGECWANISNGGWRVKEESGNEKKGTKET